MIKTHLGYNVLIFGFDSVSRMTFMRFLPKSYRYLIKELGSIVMKGIECVFDLDDKVNKRSNLFFFL